jgi:hypothetical protein
MFKVDFSLVSGSHQWCDPGSVRFFSIFFTLRESLRRPAYELLKSETDNRRRLLLGLGLRLFGVFNRLTSDERESVLIID